jgi:methionyl-tRNA formyltransferase
LSTHEVHNFVRGLSPTPCAWTKHGGTILRVYRTGLPASDLLITGEKKAGDVVHIGGEDFVVQTGDGVVRILELQQEGKKRLPVGEFLRGHVLRVGDKLA